MISETQSNFQTPLIALSRIGRLSLLHEYFDRLLIAPAVYEEVVERRPSLYGAKEIKEVP